MRFNVCLVCLMALATIASAQTWEIETVEEGAAFGYQPGCSMELDAEAHPHMAYGGDQPYYAHFDGTMWHREGIGGGQASPSCLFASLALDLTGNPRISYWDLDTGDLRYAYRDMAEWNVEVVANVGELGSPGLNSLALDLSGFPHISYYDPNRESLAYARRDTAGWHVETVDATPGAGVSSSLALDPSGHPRIAYRGADPTGLRYAYREVSGAHGEWHVLTIDTEGLTGFNPSLSFDSGGQPHISYYRWPDLMHAYMRDSDWIIETADDNVLFGELGWTSITVGPADVVHISYGCFDGGQLRYACHDVNGWQTEILADNSLCYVSFYSTVAVDGSGLPHVGYFDFDGTGAEGPGAPRPSMMCARRDGGGWQVQIVDQEGVAGRFSSLRFDAFGAPHISYFNEQTGSLDYAYRVGNEWGMETVDGLGWHGGYPSLGLDDEGNVHISYTAGRHGDAAGAWLVQDLKYAYEDGSGWRVQVVDSAVCVSSPTSLALDFGGFPHVSYTSGAESECDLRYAYLDAEGWHIQTVDTVGNTGRSTSLALDSSGNPHISYGSEVDGDLMYAYVNSGGWHFEVVDPLGCVGSSTSLVLDSSGNPHIGYDRDRPSDNLRYAYRDAAGWHVQTVDPHDCGGVSLALDDAGNPHISYYDRAVFTLRYAWRDAMGWHVETTDGPNGGNASSSLAFDPSGLAHVTYAQSYDLKYASLIPAASGHFGVEPSVIRLVSVAPNPFSGATELCWELGKPGIVDASVFDLLGRKVAVVAEGPAEKGAQQLAWRPVGLPSGAYVLRLSFNGASAAVQPLIYRR